LVIYKDYTEMHGQQNKIDQLYFVNIFSDNKVTVLCSVDLLYCVF